MLKLTNLYRSFSRVSDGRTRLTLASYANILASGNLLALAVQDKAWTPLKPTTLCGSMLIVVISVCTTRNVLKRKDSTITSCHDDIVSRRHRVEMMSGGDLVILVHSGDSDYPSPQLDGYISEADRSGLPSATPRRSSEMTSRPAFLESRSWAGVK